MLLYVHNFNIYPLQKKEGSREMNHHHSHLPVHGPENDRKPYYQRHHTVRYYAHRVRESLTTRVFKFICTIFLFLFFVVGLIAFILWLSLRPHRPRVHLEDLTILTLAQPSVPPQSSAVHFNVSIRNSNQKVDIHYDSVSCTLYYRDQSVGGAPLETEAFDQGSKNTTLFVKDLAGLNIGGQLWSGMQHDQAAGRVTLRLQINSVIKFEIFTRWDTRRHKMHANCDAVLGSDGVLLPYYRGKKCHVYFT